MKNKQENKKFCLYLTEDEIEHLKAALASSLLPKIEDTNSWNKESINLEKKLSEVLWVQKRFTF